MRYARVTVLCGGWSSEREVSLRSGAAVARGLEALGCAVHRLDVRAPGLALPPDTDAVFVALHGRYGEDGGVQRELEALGVPYTGSGPDSCRRAFDKALTREACRAAGLPVPEGRVLAEPTPASPLPLPVVVKPTREGSSVGCHRVFDADAWSGAVRDALACHGEALVEAFVPGRELTVGVVGDTVLPVVEICAPDGYYDFAAKYTAGRTRYLCPAPLEDGAAAALAILAAEVFRALDADGFARVDFRLTPEGAPFILELNSVPGFTETSLLPKAAAAAGLPFPELCGRILDRARTGRAGGGA
jgi:D-alanine-D-alanine ligase